MTVAIVTIGAAELRALIRAEVEQAIVGASRKVADVKGGAKLGHRGGAKLGHWAAVAA